jgi:hypothetical protein
MPAEYNIDLLTRQTEINEWTYQNKLETLFVFQLVFIGLSIWALMVFMKNLGLISSTFVVYGVIVLVLLLGLIIFSRLFYTRNRRDARYWNRVHFGEDGRLRSSLPAPILGSEDLQTMLNKIVAQLGGEALCEACSAPK